MGVEYDLVDTKYGRVFDLGKWMCLRRLDDFEPGPGNRLTSAEVLADVMEATAGMVSGSAEETRAWQVSIAQRVWAFCESADWQVRLMRDSERDEYAASVCRTYGFEVLDFVVVQSKFEPFDAAVETDPRGAEIKAALVAVQQEMAAWPLRETI